MTAHPFTVKLGHVPLHFVRHTIDDIPPEGTIASLECHGRRCIGTFREGAWRKGHMGNLPFEPTHWMEIAGVGDGGGQREEDLKDEARDEEERKRTMPQDVSRAIVLRREGGAFLIRIDPPIADLDYDRVFVEHTEAAAYGRSLHVEHHWPLVDETIEDEMQEEQL